MSNPPHQDTSSRRPKPRGREGWAESRRQLAETGDDELEWPEFVNAMDKDLVW